MTSRSPIRRKCRPISCRSSPASTSPWRCPAMAAMSCLPATRGIALPGLRAICRRRWAALWPGLGVAGPELWERVFSILPAGRRPRLAADKMHKAARLFGAGEQSGYLSLVSAWDDPDQLVNGGSEPKGPIFDAAIARGLPDPLDRMQYLDTITYLPDDILTKVDRASMAVALEVRVPILDHRIVEFSWRLPARFKIRGGKGKWLLRQVLYRHVPRKLLERPKSGFAIPLGTWLRGPLRAWAEELLSEKRLEEGGLLNPAPIRKRWAEHLEGTRNWHASLWTV